MGNIWLRRQAQIPDPLRVSRYRKAPDLGPHVLFFSGGSAINGMSKTLKEYTHNSIHLVTTFDSGGSSAKLRKAFNMPAIGDLRSRLMALADETLSGHPEIIALFNYRLSESLPQMALRHELEQLVSGASPQVQGIANPMRSLILELLRCFARAMPAEFDLRGASIGNLILAGGYLQTGRKLDQILFLFSKLVHVQGTVRAIEESSLHLCAQLESGEQVCSQHRITGKEVVPLTTPIKSLALSAHPDRLDPVHIELSESNRQLIQQAELICYPPGSFFTSLLANFLPEGVGPCIRRSQAHKVYIPNQGTDPEQLGMTTMESIRKILAALGWHQADCPAGEFLNIVLVDLKNGRYSGEINADELAEMGIQLLDIPLITRGSAPYYDQEKLVGALLSLI